MAKLTWTEVRAIRARYSAGGVTQRQLAQGYGVTQALVGYVVRRDIWIE